MNLQYIYSALIVDAMPGCIVFVGFRAAVEGQPTDHRSAGVTWSTSSADTTAQCAGRVYRVSESYSVGCYTI